MSRAGFLVISSASHAASRATRSRFSALATVCRAFKTGADLRKVVIAARAHPRLVRDLYAECLVSLVEGENRRRIAIANAEEQRERARIERDQRNWERSLSGTAK